MKMLLFVTHQQGFLFFIFYFFRYGKFDEFSKKLAKVVELILKTKIRA
jgi:hypothetical protein